LSTLPTKDGSSGGVGFTLFNLDLGDLFGKDAPKDPTLRSAERTAKRNLGLTGNLDQLKKDPNFVAEVDRIILGGAGTQTAAPQSFTTPVTGIGTPLKLSAFPSGEGPTVSIGFGLNQALLGAIFKIGKEVFKRTRKIPKRAPEKPTPRPKPKPPTSQKAPRQGTRQVNRKPRIPGRNQEPPGIPTRGRVPGARRGEQGFRIPLPEPAQPMPNITTTPQVSLPPVPTFPPKPNPLLGLAKLITVGVATAAVVNAARSAAAPSRGRARDLSREARPFSPSAQPFANPSPATAVGTSLNLAQLAPAAGRASLQNAFNASRGRQRERDRCEKKRRKNRKTCVEGYYREFTNRTEFKKWRRVDCKTRKTLKEY